MPHTWTKVLGHFGTWLSHRYETKTKFTSTAPAPPPPPNLLCIPPSMWNTYMYLEPAVTQEFQHSVEGHPGVFLWSVISWFYFQWNMNLGNYIYSLWFVTWRFCVTHGELELSPDICDSTTHFYVILRFESSEWLKSCTLYRGWCRYAIFLTTL